MGREEHTNNPPRAGNGLSGIQRFWPLDEGAWGYGVALFIGRLLIVCRLYDLRSDTLLATERMTGDFSEITTSELNVMMTNGLVSVSEQANIKLSEITALVVSGRTEMECRAAGVDSKRYADNPDEQLNLFGCEIEYLAMGSHGIAAGEAYYAPCLSMNVGGDFACGLLAIDILNAEKPILFVNSGPNEASPTVIAYGHKSEIKVCAIAPDANVPQSIARLLAVCGAIFGEVELVLVAGRVKVDIPPELQNRTRIVADVAIEGASAVLLSDTAEDELCRIVEACSIVTI